jgi:hypothetical protein
VPISPQADTGKTRDELSKLAGVSVLSGNEFYNLTVQKFWQVSVRKALSFKDLPPGYTLPLPSWK